MAVVDVFYAFDVLTRTLRQPVQLVHWGDTVPRQKSLSERIFKMTNTAKLLYNNHIINSKAIKNILSLYYI